ncbi:MAG: hypothetical protein N2235_06865 [Fischerella sp.]|nr:hypothetical protein [Fischerella sp.]
MLIINKPGWVWSFCRFLHFIAIDGEVKSSYRTVEGCGHLVVYKGQQALVLRSKNLFTLGITAGACLPILRLVIDSFIPLYLRME